MTEWESMYWTFMEDLCILYIDCAIDALIYFLIYVNIHMLCEVFGICSILKMNKLWPREIKWLAQDH